MHSYFSNDAVILLNAAKGLKHNKFKKLKFTRILSASQSAIRPLGVWLQNFYTAKVLTSDLRN